MRRTRTITFDCYGTLIDWASGLQAGLGEIFGSASPRRLSDLYRAYVETEAEIEAQPYQPYRSVLAAVAERLAKRFKLELPPGRAAKLATSLRTWRPFVDTNEALLRMKRKFRLGVLSNIDRDLFEHTMLHFAAPFDFVVTAQDVRSYKPAPGHFERALSKHAERGTLLHVAQSLYHDGAPATALGIPFVWINRYSEPNKTKVVPLAELPDLRSLADLACGTLQ
ncbi:MAG: HAD-IA family hydrolase [Planctomycetes bacterium]|nr:HAD-IA family hydrolase [Planctomycetota bacterium]